MISFEWAETAFPALFPQPPQTGSFANYTFRFYPRTGIALAAQNGQVFYFSDSATQRQMMDVTHLVCELHPTVCESGINPTTP
jgi:hypothetical protein